MQVVHLRYAWLARASTWSRFTLLGQALGSCALTCLAMRQLVPRVFIDTGAPEHAFGYPVANIAGAWPVCYTHYPFVSTDMIARVRNRSEMYNNQGHVARSYWLTLLKLWYYRVVALLYWLNGRYAN